jgi:hypothetical protein
VSGGTKSGVVCDGKMEGEGAGGATSQEKWKGRQGVQQASLAFCSINCAKHPCLEPFVQFFFPCFFPVFLSFLLIHLFFLFFQSFSSFFFNFFFFFL